MSRIDKITIIGGGEGDGASSITRQTVGALQSVLEAVKDTVRFDLIDVMKAQTIDAKVERNIHLDSSIPPNN